jgi:hypothetical protein
MSAAKGPQVPSQPRTLRSIALSKGTTPAGFDGAGEPQPAPVYRDAAPMVAESPLPQGAQATPFAIKGSR